MASSSASLADSGFPPAGSTTLGLDEDKVGGGGGVKFGGGGGGVKGGGGGGVKVGGGCGGANAGGVGRFVGLWLALASSDFLKCSSSAAADELIWKSEQRVRNVYLTDGFRQCKS